jgi:hypothetical protein
MPMNVHPQRTDMDTNQTVQTLQTLKTVFSVRAEVRRSARPTCLVFHFA